MRQLAAHDTVCADIIEKRRISVRPPEQSMVPPRRHLELAESLDIAVSNPDRIDLIERDLTKS